MARFIRSGGAVPVSREDVEAAALSLAGGEELAREGGGPPVAVSVALATIVRLAQDLPKGSLDRQALAAAAVPLRARLP